MSEAMSERELERIEEWLESCRELLGIIDEARVKSEGRTTKATLYQSQQLDKYLRASTSKRMPVLIDEVRRSHTEAAELRERVESLEGILRGYGRHTNKCRIYAIALREPTAKDCTCGFVTALSQENAQAKLENQGDI